MCRLLQAVLSEAGYRVSAYQNPEEAVKLLDREAFDLVISDMRMPGMTGVDVLKAVKSRAPHTPVILITAFGTTKAAVEAMRLGTSDYISKPFRNEEIRLVVEGVLERRRLAAENRRLRQELAAQDGFGGLVGASPAMRSVFRALAEAAESEDVLLIEGEPGAGKEAAARAVHMSGRRGAGPFVVVDAAALRSERAEAALFGSFSGSFPVSSGQAGLLASADGGTLLLKDAEELPEPLQTKLLRFVSDRRLRRAGSVEGTEVNARVILAAPAPPRGEDAAAEGRFRRLARLRVALPPLRERREDVAPLAAHFLSRAARRAGRGEPSISPEALELLRTRDWPGNVRDLQGAVESAAASARGRVEAADLPAGLPGGAVLARGADMQSFREAKQGVVDAFEKSYLGLLLQRSGGNMTRAAAAAGMDRKNLYDLLKKHGLDPRGDAAA
jgi:DNA-binding NtrC family response regulator